MLVMELIQGVKEGAIATVKQLTQDGIDINGTDQNGWTPLCWAAAKGNTETVKMLVELGADVFRSGRDQRVPRLIALAAGHAETATFLEHEESKHQGGAKNERVRKYCRAYHLHELQRFHGWEEPKPQTERPGQEADPANQASDEAAAAIPDIVYLHENYAVTRSIWSDEGIIFSSSAQEWKEFCTQALSFRPPTDWDLIKGV